MNTSGAPGSIVLTGGNNGSNSAGITNYTANSTITGRVSFNWSYTTSDRDGAAYDSFGYMQNGTHLQLSNNSGATTQSGLSTYAVTSGQSLGFSARTTDNGFGSASTTVSNFVVSDTMYWRGNTNSTWSGSANWALNSTGTIATTAPDSVMNVVFSATGGTNKTNTLGANYTIKSLTSSDSAAVTIGGSNTLTVSGTSGTGINVQSGAGLLTVSANVTLAGSSNTITVNNSAGAVVSGVLGGSNGLTKAGTGTLTLSGSAANTYTGTTTVNSGTLALGKTGATAISGNVTIGDGSGRDILQLGGTGGNQISDSSILNFNGSGSNAGTFRLNGTSETVGGLASTGGAGIAENNASGDSTLTLAVTGTDRSFSGVLQNGASGSLALVKTGTATQTLSGASTYTGGTTVSAGTLVLANNSAAGSSSGNVVISGTSETHLKIGSGITIANNIVFSNTGASSNVTRTVAANAAYSTGTTGTFKSSFAGGSPDTSATFLAGTNSGAARDVTTTFGSTSVATNDSLRRSDILTIGGTSSDVFAILLTPDGGLSPAASVGWQNGSIWQLAVSGNTGQAGSLAGKYTGSFTDFLNTYGGGIFNPASMLGAYGYDPNAGGAGVGGVWAVVNHGGSFAAMVPEPSGAVAGLLIACALFRRRRP